MPPPDGGPRKLRKKYKFPIKNKKVGMQRALRNTYFEGEGQLEEVFSVCYNFNIFNGATNDKLKAEHNYA